MLLLYSLLLKASDAVTTAVWKVVDENELFIVDLNDYVGTLKDNWFGKVKIALKDEKLWFTSQRSPKLNGQMYF